MKLGVVGLPNVGKSTLFNAITNAGAQAANYPFCTIEPNTGVVHVPDDRLDYLGVLYHPRKTVPATVEFVDIAGLVKGASRGEGLGNKFLSHIRQVDAVVHVVRCFEDENIIHVDGDIDPMRDIETINLELIFADMDTLTKRMEKAEKLVKTGEKKYKTEAELAAKVISHLEEGKPARSYPFTEDELEIARTWFLLTIKPVLYAANISEDDISLGEDNPLVKRVIDISSKENAQTLVISAQIEEEIASMPPDERSEYLGELGLERSGLERLIQASYSLLNLQSFFTVGEDECRAWTINKGTKAPQAAGKIHTDFERGFINAQVVPFDTLKELGSTALCREKGLVRSEGKEYIVQDGDVILFRFNV